MKNILLVAGVSGPPLDFAISRLKPLGRVFVLFSEQLPRFKIDAIERHADVNIPRALLSESVIVEEILRAVGEHAIDAVMTLDEFSIGPVSRAAHKRGLAGAGENIRLARNKWEMRRAFEAAGVRNPRFRRVCSLDDLVRAKSELRLPAVLKLTEGAWSLGHTIVRKGDDPGLIWQRNLAFLRHLAAERTLGAIDLSSRPEFIMEEFIEASTKSWYDDGKFGDLVSVEGFVKGGKYYPIAVTSKYPLVPPFTEIGQITPSVLPLPKQLAVVEFARKAVDALKLDTCATHTEIKLQANGELCMVESAARTPGALMTRQILEVFDVDMIALLAKALLGVPVEMPPFQHQPVNGAAGPVAIISLDCQGEPWKRYPVLNKGIDLRPYLDRGVEYEIAWGASATDGTAIKPYDPNLGAMNYIANVFLKAPTVEALIRSQRRLMTDAETIFVEQARQTAPISTGT